MEDVNTKPEIEEVPATEEEQEYSADIQEDTDEEEDLDDSFELEYDDDGNVVIPDDETEETGDTTPETGEEEPAPDPAPTPNADREELERVRRDLAHLRSLSSETLKKLGYNGEDPIEGLIQAAAEAEGSSVEEYKKELAEQQRKAEEERAQFDAAYQIKKKKDLEAVQAAIPSTSVYKSVEDFPNFKRFGELCDLGLSPEEAFRASHPSEVASGVAEAVAQKAMDSKEHLRSNVPRGAKDTSTRIPKTALAEYREMFPGKTDKEIVALYRRATKQTKS